MDRERLLEGERAQIKQIFREQVERSLAETPAALEDATELELLCCQALMLQQDASAPEGVAEDAIAALEERRDAAGAALLATAELLLAPSLALPAAAALERLRAEGIEAELPEGTGELGVAAARRYDSAQGEFFTASLTRDEAEPELEAVLAVEKTDSGPLLLEGAIGEPEAGELPADQGVPISADELHASIAEALETAAELEEPIPYELGIVLPIVWKASGGEPRVLERVRVAMPDEGLGLPGDRAAEVERLYDSLPSRTLPYPDLDAPRNAPCPCGSGLKAKRCCLPRVRGLRREAGALEDLAVELAIGAHLHCEACMEGAFSELFLSGVWFGFETAAPDQRLDAALWIACDGELCEGTVAPLRRRAEEGGPLPEQQAWADALAESSMRAWRIESVSELGLLDAVCPLSGEAAQLELVRAPMGDPAPGRLLVARSLPRPEGRFALLGMAPVVEPDAQQDFERLLERIEADADSPEDAWRRFGGELLHAAWSWPEQRQRTAEGEPVIEHHVVLAVPDGDALLDELSADPELTERGADWEALCWDWRPAGPTTGTQTKGSAETREGGSAERKEGDKAPGESAAASPPELGVRWALCPEDRADPPVRARLELQVEDDELWLFAVTESRLRAAEAALRERFAGVLGEELERDHDLPEISRRWQRERLATLCRDLDALAESGGSGELGRAA